MDFGLAALKLFTVQLKSATITPSQNAFSLGPILFQRAWLQGVIVSVPSSDGDRFLLLDDGSGVIQLTLSAEFLSRNWEAGMYVMVVGAYVARPHDLPMIKVHKLVDLSPFPEREPMWYLEVMEAFNIFYKPLLNYDDLVEKDRCRNN